MCGRTACTLNQHGIQRATCQYSKSKENLPWIQKFGWQTYEPNYNLSPTQNSPVIVNGTVFDPKDECDNHVLTLMRWGFIPSWYKGDIQECSLKANNCRIEGLLEKPTFRGAASGGRRCVVLADGFYEWKKVSDKKKQPYFIYFPQDEDVFSKSGDSFLDDDEWKGPKLLTMAGIFDAWKSPEAILNGEEEVSMWLDTDKVPTKEALSMLKPLEDIQMHPVSTIVGNSRNNSNECVKPFKEAEKKIKKNALTDWLIKSPAGPPAKRFRPDS
ncbi:abasic site processing protein HMCES [Trichonephila clavata]|uniref:Abasic site processing protein HMCES n=1 Tax=Trichonephila clavata TaxID=2740835 RepID=A0A8X6IG92_TRICU|nr:abasic site processing protein HMCES [Trichonephila clavata]